MALKYAPIAPSRTNEKAGATVDGVTVRGIAPGPLVAALTDPRGPAGPLLVPTKFDAVDGAPTVLVPISITSTSTVA